MNSEDCTNYLIKKLCSSESFSSPWPYSIIDEFLPSDVMNYITKAIEDGKLSERFLSDSSTKWPKIWLHQIEKIIFHPERDDFRSSLNKDISSFFDVFRSEVFKRELARVLSVDENILLKSKAQFRFSISHPGYEYQIHSDMVSKKATLLVYCSPKVNGKYISFPIGTKIYERVKVKKEIIYRGHINWKINRTLLFSSLSNTSFHNWKVPEYMNTPRIVMMINYNDFYPDK